MRIGVVALQGAVREHLDAFGRCGVDSCEIRSPEELATVDGAVLPGGESTTIGMLLERNRLHQALKERAVAGMPLWGTCAGMILMACEVLDGLPGQRGLELLELRVRRNAFGRQVDSFETLLEVPLLGKEPFPAVFIRGPLAESAGTGVDVLARHEGKIVAVRKDGLLATAFHPELSDDTRFHRLFADIVRRSSSQGQQGRAA
ncbi:MAG: pyridoxal 5'-phosphate synthase glutaminase subunit PdxT [Armatimonadetes bacterium]|nr:pyridoxal 5'-phosphate synthase glutaminase subunit PdxT [Armatimonadota bacterium]